MSHTPRNGLVSIQAQTLPDSETQLLVLCSVRTCQLSVSTHLEPLQHQTLPVVADPLVCFESLLIEMQTRMQSVCPSTV